MFRTRDLCESRGGRPGLSVPNSPYGLYGRKATVEEEEGRSFYSEVGSCEKVEVAVLSPSLIVLMVIMVPVDEKQHEKKKEEDCFVQSSGAPSCEKAEMAVLDSPSY